MTLKELLDKVSELCNEETKDFPVVILCYGDALDVQEIWHHHIHNDYVKVDEIRIM